MISSCDLQNYSSSTTFHKVSSIGFEGHTKSSTTNFFSSTQNHHCCPKGELTKNSIKMVNHVFYANSTAFPLWEISFVRSLHYFYVFMSFWMKNQLFLRCEYIAIVQRGISVFLHFFNMKIKIIINRCRSLCGR